MRQVLIDERGVALLIALMTLVIVSLLGAGALTLATGTINQTMWDRSSNQAFQLAEAGFDKAVARVRNDELDGDFTVKLLNGEAQIQVTQMNAFMYNVKSTGAVPSLAAPEARRAIEAIIVHFDASKLLYADGASGIINGIVSVDGPFYVHDLMNLSGTSKMTGGPFFIKDNPATLDPTGDLVLGGTSQMGTDASPTILFVDGTYPPPVPVLNSRLYTSAIYTDVPDLEMPVIDSDAMQDQLNNANVVLDDADAIANQNFRWPYTNGPKKGLWLDKFAPSETWGDTSTTYMTWINNGSDTPTLAVKGTVFVDGDVSIGDKVDAVEYTQTGTIVANGNIAIETELRPDPVPFPKDAWPVGTAIGLITPYEMDINAGQGDEIFAVLYAYEKINIKFGFNFYGNMMTGDIITLANPQLHIIVEVDESDLPPNMPKMKAQTSVTGWREVQP